MPLMTIPSVPFFPNASLPELVWLASSLTGAILTLMAWRKARAWQARMKNALRLASNVLFVVVGMMAMSTPPALNPTWLSVLTPMAIAAASVGMTFIAVIDEQTTAEHIRYPFPPEGVLYGDS
jgi:hypothetical protein